MIPVEDRKKEMKDALTALAGLIAVGLFLWFVWPTRYERGERRIGQAVYPIRIHRISRRVEMLSTFGWEDVSATPEPDPMELPASELAKVTLKCSSSPFGVLECDVLNESTWSLSEVTVTVRVLNQNGTEARKQQYKMTPDSRLHFDPGDTTKGLVQLDFSVAPDQKLDWALNGAKGVAPQSQ